jgi:RimJ/RimL family protein N-acetyltransferase
LPYTRDLAHLVVDDAEEIGAPTGGSWLQLAITDDGERLLGDVAVWLDDDELLAVVGYTLATEHQGKGYATEALAALLDWLFTVAKVHRVSATIDPQNLPSARVLERNGFRYVGTARAAALVRGEWADDTRFELLADDWREWKRRPRTPGRVELVEITRDNMREVGALDRSFSQRQFVSSVYQSYGDALLASSRNGDAAPWYRAITADGEPVGFMMVAEPTATRRHPYLWRFMIDWHHQRRGVGRAALRELAALRAAGGDTHLLLSCVADVPSSPERFYAGLGFERTGHVNEWGETEMIAPLERLIRDERVQAARSRRSTRRSHRSST